MSIIYQAYHIHSSDSNIYSPDSILSKEDYAKKAVEYGHGILSSLEHGFQGQYHKTYEIAKKYGLKFIFGVEAYWVKDRLEKDNTNAHICLFARNEAGRRQINLALSIANEDGYYYRPRVDIELLKTLNPNDVLITTACLAFWKYDDILDIVKDLHNHFGDSLYLEVQAHHTEKQYKVNRVIQILSKQLGIQMIAGTDSHFIDESDAIYRDIHLESSGVFYEDEDGWFMDYPDGNTLYQRFVKQGILTDEEIMSAINNTNVFLEFEDIELDKSLKLPRYKGDTFTQKERNQLYYELVMGKLERFLERESIPLSERGKYREEAKKEIYPVIKTNLSDYFLINYEIIRTGKRMGGEITDSGRGSAVSYFTNTLLNFSSVNRLSSPVHLYPERFISLPRLESGQLPDIDFNLSNPDIFAKAQELVLGKHKSYPMIAYGTYKDKSAWKMYAKAKDIPFEISNEVSNQIEEYETALKYEDLEDGEETQIDIKDFIDEKYHEMLEASKLYKNITTDRKRHPCAYILSEDDIREEIGIIRCKDHLTAVIDGSTAEKFGYLKNDLLKVNVVKIIHGVYDRVGVKPHTITELRNITKDNPKVWDIYKNGHTLCINQVEKESTTQKVMRFKPENEAELCAFVAGIRPSFKSIYPKLERRENFSYNIPVFDSLIQTEEMPSSFVLYQEQIMATLNYAGFPSADTYTILKAISKKKEDVIIGYKEQFINGFSSKIIEDEPGTPEIEAQMMAQDVWQVVEDSSEYGFNASHSLCVAYDSMYGAYLKSHYPHEFYEVAMNLYSEDGDKNKVAQLKQEALSAFGIRMGQLRWGIDNRGFRADTERNIIGMSMLSLKRFNYKISEELYNLSQNRSYDNIIDVLYDIKEHTSVNKTQLEVLATLDYFEEFIGAKKLLKILPIFQDMFDAKQLSKAKAEKNGLCFDDMIQFGRLSDSGKTVMDFRARDMFMWLNSTLDNEGFNSLDKVRNEFEHTGAVSYVLPDVNEDIAIITSKEENRWGTNFVDIYYINSGDTLRGLKIFNKYAKKNPVTEGDLILVNDVRVQNKKRKNKDGKFVEIEDTETILGKYTIIGGNE